MAKRKSATQTPARHRHVDRRPRAGPMGPQGPPGVAGAPGHNHTSELAMLKAQVDQLGKELQTQLTRIGQIQAQLDHVSTGQASEPRNRRSTDSTEH